MTVIQQDKLRIAVIGAGPGGLAATINLLRLPFVELSVFDQATELREVGAGISINQNTWRHLQLLGAAEAIEQYTKRGDGTKIALEQRNGRTGELLKRTYQSVDPNKPARSRIERYKLQQALLQQIPQGLIQLNKRLDSIDESNEEGVVLTFKDESVEGPFGLVVGADGIRSAVRQHTYPSHRLSYTGKTAFRTLIPASAVAHIPNLPPASTFWHTAKTHVYTNFLDGGLFEIATRAEIADDPENGREKVSWGQKVGREDVVGYYVNYCETIRQVIAAPTEWLEFAMFGGPRLESVISNGRIALLGDASHPLSGAFGSGAAFAFEDAYVLAQSLSLTHTHRHRTDRGEGASKAAVGEALELYDGVRSPHYKNLVHPLPLPRPPVSNSSLLLLPPTFIFPKALANKKEQYSILNAFSHNTHATAASHPPGVDEDAYIAETTRRNWSAENEWIYTYDVTDVWAGKVRELEQEKEAKEVGELGQKVKVLSVGDVPKENVFATPVEA
ncbi:salicylate hydroxylase [Cryptococcus wingfieldii CBS 7118]|uniref:Salicylate hydroxylase n=1 Tax=Cryptococcus wingfieldii CBS 7118 TaxID=1295528 RepID=A0A1E3IGG3_9TREE|nr:salicylate hydroxylase [Cryptococcus wingfieldii CBS 7118]ODN86831.1 salicylate hydroxylase [Cryptococcus wingfieldii CBS 7118]